MADKSYDIVIVGAGNKVSVTAMYLTKYGGMSVGLFEDRHEAMTGWCGEDIPAPGCLMNQCSHYHVDAINYHKPLWEDIPEWKEYGAQYNVPRLSLAFIDKDEDCWCGFYSMSYDPTQEKTAKLIARYSQKDAETWLWLCDKINKYWQPAVLEWVFNPPPPIGVPDALEQLVANPAAGINPEWAEMTPIQLYQEMFESPFVQGVFIRGVQSGAIQPDLPGQGLLSLFVLCLWTNGGWVKGGTHQLAHATQRVITENGGEIFNRATVVKVLVENGRAKGVRLSDGTEIEARKAVLTGVDPHQVIFELTGEEHFDEKDVNIIKKLEYDYNAAMWYSWVLNEPIKYRAEAFDSDITECGWTICGTKDFSGVIEEQSLRRNMKWPNPEHFQLIVSDPSGMDASFAPPGKYGGIITEEYVVPAHALSDAEWKVKEKEHAQEVVTHLSKYSPNFNWDNIYSYGAVTPQTQALQSKSWGKAGNWMVIDLIPSQTGRNRPTPNLSGGRTPVKGLFCSGAGYHPFGWAHSFQGYWMYKVLAEEFGLRKPWEEKGRSF